LEASGFFHKGTTGFPAFVHSGAETIKRMRGFQTAWHYTTWNNWEKIKCQGLKRYYINKPLYQDVLRSLGYKQPVNGIWLWPNKLQGLAHTGSVYFQASTKDCPVVVLLKVKYKPSDILLEGRDIFTIRHNGEMGNLKYHDRVPALISFQDIPASRIKLAGAYDLQNQFKRSSPIWTT